MVFGVLVGGQRQGDERPGVVAVAFGAVACGDALPCVLGKFGCDLVGSLGSEAGGDAVRAGDGEDVAQVVAA